MPQFGGKNAKKTSSDSKRHFTAVMGGKEHGLYVSSTPSSAAKKAVTKLCTANKSKKVEFYMRETTQGSKKKTYGPYSGYIEKLKEPIELKGRVIKYKPVAKLSGKTGAKKGGNDGSLLERMKYFKSDFSKSTNINLLVNRAKDLFKEIYDEAVKPQDIYTLKILLDELYYISFHFRENIPNANILLEIIRTKYNEARNINSIVNSTDLPKKYPIYWLDPPKIPSIPS